MRSAICQAIKRTIHQQVNMSTDISKSDEVNESMFNMDEGEDDLLGQSIINDLLDKEDGADVGGNQSDTQLATEKGNREQSHSHRGGPYKPRPRGNGGH